MSVVLESERLPGTCVVICGPDGAGKSTLSSRLASLGLAPHAVVLHWRPGLLPRLASLAGGPAPDGLDPHAGRPYGPLLSLLRATYYWLDQVLGYWLRIRPRRRAGDLVILERGPWDMAVDPVRYRVRLPVRFLELLARLAPQPDLTLVLTGDAGTFVRRKRELPVAEVARQVSLWRALAQQNNWVVLDATRPIEDVIEDTIALIAARGRAAIASSR